MAQAIRYFSEIDQEGSHFSWLKYKISKAGMSHEILISIALCEICNKTSKKWF